MILMMINDACVPRQFAPGFVAAGAEFWHTCKDMQTRPEKNSSIPASVPSAEPHSSAIPAAGADRQPAEQPREIGGPAGPEPTRFGDWERKGRCIDF